MKRLLLPFILFCSIPFNTSCITEVTFKVTITGSNCTWDKPKRATRAHTYKIKIVPDEGYDLYIQEGVLEGTVGNLEFVVIGDDLYDQETCYLTIPAEYVGGDIVISANADPEQK